MPKRTDINSILIIGAGPIVIGQACEFDYSGTQACKALKEEGYRVVLVNSNPATIMTDPDLADATYIEPITPEIVAKIIEKERPDALLPTMGGQTALNCALSLRRMGTLEKFGVTMIGATADAIDKAEDRALFREAMHKIGLETPRSHLANASELKKQDREKYRLEVQRIGNLKASEAERARLLKEFELEWRRAEPAQRERYQAQALIEALQALDFVGLPAIIRPSFTLGGTGGGIAYTKAEFLEIVEGGLDASPTNEVLIEESVLGWKEYEMEVVRDKKDNCIIICSIENVDPMGVHTGDSITIAPALTLTDKEYQIMRDASIAVLREIGVETGGSNVQFAVNPADGRLVIIEMNPRVSRSSALASKATGFPIAKVAAKLAVGYTLDEIANDITGGATPASFEPTIDYVVAKIPRFAFEKFPGASTTLTTSMKSVGEAMAIGRTFQESLQKALRSLETGLTGLDEVTIEGFDPAKGIDDADNKNNIRAALGTPTPDRLLKLAQAMRLGASDELIHNACRIDPWFLAEIRGLVEAEAEIKAKGLPTTPAPLRRLKAMGFSDKRLGKLTGNDAEAVAEKRRKLGVRPVFKRIDTCAAEFASPTAYMYSTYETPFNGKVADEAAPSDKKKVVILGGGPNRIGQGIEFDYCCCHAAFALKEAGYETIMVNCNPETVSTDYDTSDRLYFEPLTPEDVLEIIDTERSNGTLHGVIVQFGGQTPLKLAEPLEKAKVPILGTSPDMIDLAEDRERFKTLLDKLKMRQPKNGIATSLGAARAIADEIGYPVVIRPSNVLGGRAMEIVRDTAQFDRYLAKLASDLDRPGELVVSKRSPLLIDRYLSDATEVDVDCLADGKDTFIAGIMEHIEEAGIHSGDSACALPPHSLSKETIAELERQTEALALALEVGGLMNVQYAIKEGDIYVLEVNPRASRTVPFVAKVIGLPVAKIAARVMAGESLASFKLAASTYKHRAVKEAVFPFARFPGVDTVLGPEMKSTGEVMGIDSSFEIAFAKSQIGGGTSLPRGGTVFVSVRDADKPRILPSIKLLASLGFRCIATSGTQRYLAEQGVEVAKINKVLEGRPNVVDVIKNGGVQLVFNTTEGATALADSRSLRHAALLHKVPYYTTLSGAVAAAQGIKAYLGGDLEVRALQSYYGSRA
jgi:carbamoyl-phosphate synthase large subunit